MANKGFLWHILKSHEGPPRGVAVDAEKLLVLRQHLEQLALRRRCDELSNILGNGLEAGPVGMND